MRSILGESASPCICNDARKPLWSFVADILVYLLLAFVLLAFSLEKARGDQMIMAKPGRLNLVKTKLDSKKLIWKSLDDCDMIPDSNGTYAIVLCPLPGKFRIIVFGAKLDEPLAELITITVEGTPPSPPDPPGPKPPPVPPADDLDVKIGTAWQMEFASDKVAYAKSLAGVYRHGIQALESSPTWGDVFDRMNTQARSNGALGKLLNVQEAIMPFMTKTVPTTRTAKVDSDTMAKGKTLFTRIATILEGLR